MSSRDKHDETSSTPLQPDGDGIESTRADEARRKLMAKLAAGAFAVPAMLASVSRSSANPSN